MYERRSIRRFNPRAKIPDEKIDQILDSARYAWDPYEIQSWRFILVKDKRTKRLIGDYAREISHAIFGISYEIFRGHLWYLPEERIPKIAEYAQSGELWATYPMDCSFIILPCITHGAWTDNLLGGLEMLSAASIGMAIENMWLAAHAMGIGSACNAMPLNDIRRREELCEFLGIPSSWFPLAADCFGQSALPRMLGPSRMPLESITFVELWGNRYKRSAFRDVPPVEELPTMDLMDAMKKVEQVYEFSTEEVEEWKIERLLDVARWSPNPENLNHWRHILIRDEETKELITQMTKEGWEAMHKASYSLLRSHYFHVPEEDFLEYLERIRGYWKFPSECDTIIITSFPKAWVEYSGPGGGLPGGIDHIWAAATATGIQNMRIAAIALGLGTNFNIFPFCEPRREEVLIDHLGIPKTWTPVGALCIGVPEGVPERRPRAPLSTLVFDEYWGNPHA
jgi:nitroreductase